MHGWEGWRRLLVGKLRLKPRQWGQYERLVRARVEETQEGGAAVAGVRVAPPSPTTPTEEEGQEGGPTVAGWRTAPPSSFQGLPLDVLLKLKEYVGRSGDFHQLLRLNRGLRGRLLAEPRLWQCALFNSSGCRWDAVETMIRR